MSASVLHTCAGREHAADIQPEGLTKLGCGCTRARGTRCDGTPIEWIATAVCTRHRDEETAAGSHSPADATPSDAPRARDEGPQRPARSSTKPGPGLGVTPPPGWHWRYLPGGFVLHALHHPGSRTARCGVGVRGRAWRGDANQAERDRAASLAICRTCLRSINAQGRGDVR